MGINKETIESIFLDLTDSNRFRVTPVIGDDYVRIEIRQVITNVSDDYFKYEIGNKNHHLKTLSFNLKYFFSSLVNSLPLKYVRSKENKNPARNKFQKVLTKLILNL